MDEISKNSNEEVEHQEFLKALDAAPEMSNLTKGDLKSGKILQISENYVYVDIGLKSEAKIDIAEFDKLPNEGDVVEVLITSQEDESGSLIVSKRLADREKNSKEIEEAFAENKNLKGYVKSAVKAGFSVSIGGFMAFCPYSQIDFRPSRDESTYIGNEYDFRIIKKTNRDIVVSRKVILDEIRDYSVNNFLANLKQGDVIQGKIKNIEKFGTFVEIAPGLDGFLAIPNMSWSKVSDVKSIISKNEERMFKVLNVDKEKQKVDLGIKQLDSDPWVKFVESHKVGDVVKGTVGDIKQFGAFIKIEDGVEGLAHVSDLSWNTHVQDAKDHLKVGDFVECKILDINVESRKFSLGLKQVQENPWDSLATLYPPKSMVKCKVKRILKNFAVFELPNGIEGICDIGDFDWSNSVVNIDNYVKKDEEVEVIVLSVDKDKQRIKLSYKHTKDSPWKLFEKKHPVGSSLEATAVSIVDAGVVVSLEDDMEGFVHVSQLDMPRGTNIDTVIEVGKSYTFTVKEINQSKRRIALSQRDYIANEAKKELKGYINNDDTTTMKFNYFEGLNNKDK